MENEILNWINNLCKDKLKVSEISFRELSITDLFYVYVEVYAKFGILLPMENGDFLNSNIDFAKYIVSYCNNKNSDNRLNG